MPSFDQFSKPEVSTYNTPSQTNGQTLKSLTVEKNPNAVQARTLSKSAHVLLVEDGRVILHMDGNIQNNSASNVLTFFLNINAESYMGMTMEEQYIWNKVNKL